MEISNGFYRLIRRFDPAVDRTINQDGITVEQNSWKIESCGEKKILLFKIAEPNVSECLLMCKAEVRTANLFKPAKLVLSAKNSAGWIWDRHEAVQGTTTWHTCKVPFHYKKERFSDSVNVLVCRLGSPPQIIWLTCGNVTNRNLKRLLTITFEDAIEKLQNNETIVEVTRK